MPVSVVGVPCTPIFMNGIAHASIVTQIVPLGALTVLKVVQSATVEVACVLCNGELHQCVYHALAMQVQMW